MFCVLKELSLKIEKNNGKIIVQISIRLIVIVFTIYQSTSLYISLYINTIKHLET